MTPKQAPQPLLQKNNWWFILGREKALSAAEIAAFLRLETQEYSISPTEPVLFLDNLTEDSTEIIKKLGGTIKICRLVAKGLNRPRLIKTIQDELRTKTGKIVFGLSTYGNLDTNELTRLGKEIKNNLKNDGLSVRFVPNKEKTLSSATVDHNNLMKKGGEFVIYETSPQKFSLAQTTALQPYEEFSKRDFDRPGRDDRSGMLPPKLAMMIINLSLPKEDDIILDPFCGSGTILTEAMILGYKKLIGSDISARAVSDTQKNIDWIKSNLNVSCPEISLYNLDVKNLAPNLTSKIDRIVAEPFLGKPLTGKESYEMLEKQSLELKQLYVDAFTVFEKILNKNGVVVFVFPRFQADNKKISTAIPEKIKSLGFKLLPFPNQEYLTYERPGQRVAREIWRFQKV